MIEAYSRGHKIQFDKQRQIWVWSDTLIEIDDSRPCKRCGSLPTPEGHDACLGEIPGLIAACCGHGIDRDEYYMKEVA